MVFTLQRFKLPKLITGFTRYLHTTDPYLGIDKLGRYVLQLESTGPLTLPVQNLFEFASFFSVKNYILLMSTISSETGGRIPTPETLITRMRYVWSGVDPRGSEFDLNSGKNSPEITLQYVEQMDRMVVDEIVPIMQYGGISQETIFHMKTHASVPRDNLYIPPRFKNQADLIDFSRL